MDFEEGIATFKSEALQMSSGSGGSWLDKQAPPPPQRQKQAGALSDQDDHDKSERWDPVMTSLLKANNAAESSGRPSYSNSYLHSGSSSSPLQLGGFSDLDSNLQATIHLGSTHSAQSAIATPVLNAPSSAGASATKVSKKRSRASRRPPTTVLEADSANFRSMVQHLTGIPAPPPMLAPPSLHHLSSSRFDFLGVGVGIGSGLVRPQPTRHFTASSSFGSGFSTPGQLLLDHHANTNSNSSRGLFGHPAGTAHFTQQQQQQLAASLTKLDDLRSSFSYSTRPGAPYPGHDNLDTSDTSSSSRNLIGNNSTSGGFHHHHNSSSTTTADTTSLRPSSTQQQGGGVLYAGGGASGSGVSNAAASCLSMPVAPVPTMPSLALWECEAPGGGGGGGECLSVSRSRIKREVEVGVAEEVSGRPMASWSTSL